MARITCPLCNKPFRLPENVEDEELASARAEIERLEEQAKLYHQYLGKPCPLNKPYTAEVERQRADNARLRALLGKVGELDVYHTSECVSVSTALSGKPHRCDCGLDDLLARIEAELNRGDV